MTRTYPSIPNDRWAEVLRLVTTVQDHLVGLQDKEYLPHSAQPSNLGKARFAMIVSKAALRSAKATSQEAKQIASDIQRRKDIDAKRLADEKVQRVARRKEIERAAAVEAARLNIRRACREVPGLNFQKFLNLVITILEAQRDGRSVPFDDFNQMVQGCIHPTAAKKHRGSSVQLSAASKGVIQQLTDGLISLAGSIHGRCT